MYCQGLFKIVYFCKHVEQKRKMGRIAAKTGKCIGYMGDFAEKIGEIFIRLDLNSETLNIKK